MVLVLGAVLVVRRVLGQIVRDEECGGVIRIQSPAGVLQHTVVHQGVQLVLICVISSGGRIQQWTGPRIGYTICTLHEQQEQQEFEVSTKGCID